MGDPSRSGGRYTAPANRQRDVQRRSGDEGVAVRFHKSGQVVLPSRFAVWLEFAGLMDEFDDHWHQCTIQRVHGNAVMVFAEVFDAPPDVLEAIRNFG